MCLLQDTLHYSHQVEVPVKCIQGVLYCRVSAGLYNVLEDYQRLAQAVNTIAAAAAHITVGGQ
jgi:selenocysteine lyase/cysteine desulfurase